MYYSVDILVVVGKLSPLYLESKRFYRALQESRRREQQRMVNSPFIAIDEVHNILSECPDRLAISLQFFLQGIGKIKYNTKISLFCIDY
jgi:hypothetical protein